MSIEAMKQALETLKRIDDAMPFPVAKLTMQQLRQAIQEASENGLYREGYRNGYEFGEAAGLRQAIEQKQEPVGTVAELFTQTAWERLDVRGSTKVYLTPPPQRTWVGLTDELQAALWDASRAALPRFHTYATLIEKELRILNT